MGEMISLCYRFYENFPSGLDAVVSREGDRLWRCIRGKNVLNLAQMSLRLWHWYAVTQKSIRSRFVIALSWKSEDFSWLVNVSAHLSFLRVPADNNWPCTGNLLLWGWKCSHLWNANLNVPTNWTDKYCRLSQALIWTNSQNRITTIFYNKEIRKDITAVASSQVTGSPQRITLA